MIDRRSNVAGLSRTALALVFAVALTARLALLGAGPWRDPGRAKLPDSYRYLELADNLGRHGTFGLAEEESTPWRRIVEIRDANGTGPARDANGLRYESLRTPGYPLVIAAVRSIAADDRAVLVLQCLLGSLAACAAVGIARAIGLAPRISTAVGLLWAIHPALVVYDDVFMTESLFNAGIAAGLLLATRAKSPAGCLGVGGLIGLASLIRPMVGFLYLPAAIALAWPRPGRRSIHALCILVAALGPSAAWSARNWSRGEGFRVSTVGDLTLFYYSAAYAISEERGQDWSAAWPARVDELADRLGRRVAPGVDVYRASRAIAFEELARRPVVTAKVLAKSQVKLFVNHSVADACHVFGFDYKPSGLFSRLVLGESAEKGPGGPGLLALAATWTLLNVAIAAAGLLGLVLTLRRRDLKAFLACGLPVVLIAVVTSTSGLERFRLAMMLPLVLLAGYAATPGAGKRSASSSSGSDQEQTQAGDRE